MLISDFARLGCVSVRMLRHYDSIGLLRPADVDPHSGYRSYAPEQLPVLNRLVALKDLGFSLEAVRGLLADDPGSGEIRGMLSLRRAELEEEARAVGTRLAAVESRLRMIEQENTMSPDYVVKTVPAARLVARTALLQPEEFGTAIGEMFQSVAADLGHRPGALATPMATYAERAEGTEVVVGYVTSGDAPEGTEVVQVPEATVVSGVHLGAMDTIAESWQALNRWVVENGYAFDGPCREVYVRSDSADQSDWVTELQEPVVRR